MAEMFGSYREATEALKSHLKKKRGKLPYNYEEAFSEAVSVLYRAEMTAIEEYERNMAKEDFNAVSRMPSEDPEVPR